MAQEEADKSAGQDPAEALIDDLIRDILSESGQATKGRVRGGDPMATLIETALASAGRTAPGAPAIERLLFAQLLASALADALAPALAESLTPEIVKFLESQSSEGRSRGEPAAPSGGTQRGGRRKT